MTKHEAILEGDDRNFTINFGPSYVLPLVMIVEEG